MQVTYSQNIHTLGFTVEAYSTAGPIVKGMIEVYTTDCYGTMVSVLDNMDALNYYCE